MGTLGLKLIISRNPKELRFDENKFGEIDGKDAGFGERIPNMFTCAAEEGSPVSLYGSPMLSSSANSLDMPLWSVGYWAFSIVASFAAGDIPPHRRGLGKPTGEMGLIPVAAAMAVVEGEEFTPVRCWTRDLKSPGLVWMTFGDTV